MEKPHVRKRLEKRKREPEGEGEGEDGMGETEKEWVGEKGRDPGTKRGRRRLREKYGQSPGGLERIGRRGLWTMFHLAYRFCSLK